MDLLKLSIEEFSGLQMKCDCGREHFVGINNINIGKDLLKNLIDKLKSKKVFMITDTNIYNFMGIKIENELSKEAEVKKYVFPQKHLIPDERAIGRLLISIDKSVDILLAVGSGTINDITRFISYKLQIPYYIVCSSPSMDGYASMVSPLIVDEIKTTYNAVYPSCIMADINLLKEAPMQMINSGLGDVLGKYSALVDWRISKLIHKEYYCENVASLVEKALNKCTTSCNNLLLKDDEGIKDLIETLVLTGLCIGMVDSSRPASGEEHHLSHYWEMKSMDKGTYGKWLHGNMVGVGTNVMLQMYKFIKNIDIEKVNNEKIYLNLSEEQWTNGIIKGYGDKKAESIIHFKKDLISFTTEKRKENFKKIYDNWTTIINIIDEMLQQEAVLIDLFINNEAPQTPIDIELDKNEFYYSLICAKDIRRRYGVFQLLEDIGLLKSAAEFVTEIYYKA